MSKTAKVQSKEQVISRLREQQIEMRALGVERIGLFGSFVRDESTDESDVDLLIEFVSGQKTFDHFIALSYLLRELFQRPVELVTPESLSPYFGPRILETVEYVSIAA